MMRLPALLLLPVLIAMVNPGCAVQYTNIPPIEGDRFARHDPNRRNVREAAALALDAVAAHRGFTGPVRVSLPEGSSESTYAAVFGAMNADAREASTLDAAQVPTLEVRRIHLRSTRGELDIVQRRPDDAAQLVTVYLDHSTLGGWSVARVRLWRIGSDWPGQSE
ncbi:MAG: hypothetical protein WD009_09835, partial [Phycisphaeraceae bacterium]